ncbi:pentatricopeptide repeat-containing protein [Canna indica]|uniref:Pentatricopeptide repeat-containing protein n=1 Tax=Canna indica TaxID=4628 RepID=A0AAQ3KVH8_9LILI|nr:pentatricopeptide repeat-containing protein [Canna indica]
MCSVDQSTRMLFCTRRKIPHVIYKLCGSLSRSGFTSEASNEGIVVCSDGAVRLLELQELLQLCARKQLIRQGKCCHGLVVQFGLLVDVLTCNILINFYSKCGDVDFARRVFDRMPERSMVTWNTMIAAQTRHGKDTEALGLFLQMRRDGTSASEFTLSSVLCACAAGCALMESQQLHALALKSAMDSNVFVGTAVLDVYTKCKMVCDARLVFDAMSEKSSVTWSSMVAGYVQNDLYEEAIWFFCHAQRNGVELTQFTLSAVLSACASLAATTEGKQLHAIVARAGFGHNLFVATSLIDVYSRCGCIRDAYLVFGDIEEKNIVLWNAMITGFSKHARPDEAMILFEKMQQLGLQPNEITYISLLSACSHVGLVEKGRRYFDLLMRDDAVRPNVLHYSCMVDVLGRAGQIDEAWELIRSMPFRATSSMWGSMLNSCRVHGNLELAKLAAEHLFELEPNNAGNHVLLSNIYAANKQWREVALSRKLLKDSGARKEIGKSWIEVKGKVHIFVVGENNHPRITEIYAKLEDLRNEMNRLLYKVEIQYDLHDVEEDQKEELLSYHSERLALAFALIELPSEIPIRIYKNLRVCGDCHSFLKTASRITDREIIARDTNRFHHFNAGHCSCGDFW